jgi:hypothetical protein
LHIEKAHPHLVGSKFGLTGIHGFNHPPYRPDIAPCDFSLFGYLKRKFEGMFFKSRATLLAEVEQILENTHMTEWVKMFRESKGRLKQCIDAEGEYLETDQFDDDVLFTIKAFSGRQDFAHPLQLENNHS